MKSIFAALILILAAATAFAEPIRSFDCMVEAITDGDTVRCAVKNSGGAIAKLRLYGIDAPEIEHSSKKTGKISKPGQPYGAEAAAALTNKIPVQTIVHVDVQAIDRYKRMVGLIKLGNRDINKEMVADGYAWAYRQYLDRPHASEYIKAEEQARSKRLGLWQQSNPQPPWEFRKLQKKGKGRHNDEG